MRNEREVQVVSISFLKEKELLKMYSMMNGSAFFIGIKFAFDAAVVKLRWCYSGAALVLHFGCSVATVGLQ